MEERTLFGSVSDACADLVAVTPFTIQEGKGNK